MRVAVVGAGVSGLAAARRLQREGCEVAVFEGRDEIGGRCATVTIEGYTFDPGATSVVPRGHEIEKVMLEELPTDDLVEVTTPVYTHDGRRAYQGAGLPPTKRYNYRPGIRRLAELLGEGLKIETGRRVDAIETPPDGGYSLFGGAYEAVVLAVTTSEAERLTGAMGDSRKANNTRYRACLTALFGFSKKVDVPYHAVVSEESVHPLHWMSIEEIKVPGRAPDGHSALVVQLGPKYSKWNFEAEEDSVFEDALIDVERVLGKGFSDPAVKTLVRWKESQPDSISGFDSVNPPGSTLVIAGDGLEGGRIEHAYDCGIKAAEALLKK